MNFGKVLVVDDLKPIREIVIFYVESLGTAEFIEAESGVDAIEKIKAHPDLNLVICDYRMTPGNGFDVLFDLRKNSNIPYILHSSCTFDENAGFKNYQNIFHLNKPINETELSSILKKCYPNQDATSNSHNVNPPDKKTA